MEGYFGGCFQLLIGMTIDKYTSLALPVLMFIQVRGWCSVAFKSTKQNLLVMIDVCKDVLFPAV